MSGFTFRPAHEISSGHGCFVALTGGTNAGKTFSALRLARGIAGKNGKIAVIDSEGGRTLHLKNDFKFDALVMEPPFRPERFADACKSAEDAKYDVVLIDSWSMEWTGIGGILDWQAEELEAAVERQRATAMQRGWQFDENKAQNANKLQSWIKPKMAHKAAVYSLLQRRIPIIFSIRGEESIDPETKKKTFKSVCNQAFPFEVTVSFRLAQDAKGIIDLSDKSSYKMEGAHADIFKHGEQLSERHGELLARWARGELSHDATPQQPQKSIEERGQDAARQGTAAYKAFWTKIIPEDRDAMKDFHEEFKKIAAAVDAEKEG